MKNHHIDHHATVSHVYFVFVLISKSVLFNNVLITRCHPFTRVAATLLFWRVFLNAPTINEKRNIKSCMFDVLR
jgi:hypothetical protein